MRRRWSQIKELEGNEAEPEKAVRKDKVVTKDVSVEEAARAHSGGLCRETGSMNVSEKTVIVTKSTIRL